MDLNQVWTSGELISAGLAYTVMGVLVVFAVLVIIMVVIKAMALFSNEKKNEIIENPAPKAASAVPVEKKTDDTQLIAVITAAIAAAMGKTGATGFRVRSYRVVSDGAWNKAGRYEALEKRI